MTHVEEKTSVLDYLSKTNQQIVFLKDKIAYWQHQMSCTVGLGQYGEFNKLNESYTRKIDLIQDKIDTLNEKLKNADLNMEK